MISDVYLLYFGLFWCSDKIVGFQDYSLHTPTYENIEDMELRIGEVELHWQRKRLPSEVLHISIFHL